MGGGVVTGFVTGQYDSYRYNTLKKRATLSLPFFKVYSEKKEFTAYLFLSLAFFFTCCDFNSKNTDNMLKFVAV
jgi:hypothetical protein